jgi:hypothetical protein
MLYALADRGIVVFIGHKGLQAVPGDLFLAPAFG